MILAPPFEDVLEALAADRKEAFLLWYASGETAAPPRSETLQEVMARARQLDFESCFERLNQLELKELVTFALMNEFGPGFAGRPGFSRLSERVTERLRRKIKAEREEQQDPPVVVRNPLTIA